MKQIKIGNKIFKTQSECETYARSILTELGIIESVKLKSEEHFNFLILLCQRHPCHNEKLNKMVDFKIKKDTLNDRGFALEIINSDNTQTDISWRICVTGKKKSPKHSFNEALRQSVKQQTDKFKQDSDLEYCSGCNCSLNNKRIHTDHHEIQFKKLVEDFLEKYKEIKIPTEYDKNSMNQHIFNNKDVQIGKLFEHYHLQHATLRILCETCNLTREKYKT